jgi:alkanesulfonate monooxygenase SsuD/methylene tetrahydromethanopterin reductase-like flavin-dependent oxidoreductase (luciferase family)
MGKEEGALVLPRPVLSAAAVAPPPARDRGQQPPGRGRRPSESTTRPRGRRADEAIDVLRALWGGDATGTIFDAEFRSFENVTRYPKPLQMLPIHVGGSSAAPPAAPAGEATGSSTAAG